MNANEQEIRARQAPFRFWVGAIGATLLCVGGVFAVVQGAWENRVAERADLPADGVYSVEMKTYPVEPPGVVSSGYHYYVRSVEVDGADVRVHAFWVNDAAEPATMSCDFGTGAGTRTFATFTSGDPDVIAGQRLCLGGLTGDQQVAPGASVAFDAVFPNDSRFTDTTQLQVERSFLTIDLS